jgi:hypothetical protein
MVPRTGLWQKKKTGITLIFANNFLAIYFSAILEFPMRTPIFYCIGIIILRKISCTSDWLFIIYLFCDSWFREFREILRTFKLKCTCVTYHFTMFFLHKSCGKIRFWIEIIFREFAKIFAKFANRQSGWNVPCVTSFYNVFPS